MKRPCDAIKDSIMTKKILLSLFFIPLLLSGCQIVNALQPVATTAPSGTLLFADDFTSNSNHWGISGGNAGKISFLYQGLDIKVNQANSMIWTVAGKKFCATKLN